MKLDEHRRQSYELWETMAAGWYRERAFLWSVTRTVGERMVEQTDPQPGQTILEIAAGIGDTGFLAAERIGERGRLISTDFSPRMVEAAREQSAELGLTNVEHRVMDAERMDLDDSSVDGVLCRWGYMLMADPAAAFRETRRVLRERGRLCFAVWAGAERNPWAAIAGMTLVERGHMPPPEPGDPGIFALADPQRIRELVTAAGFAEPTIEEVEVAFTFDDPDDYWRFVSELAGRSALVIAELSDQEKDELRSVFGERIAPFSENGSLRIPGVTLSILTS